METLRQRRVDQRCNRQFYDLINSDKRFVVHQGGTRSGKTYAICQYLVYLLTTSEEPLVISVIRKTLPSLKGSVLRDLMGILDETGVLHMGEYNKSASEFRYKNHLVEFLSLDEPQKVRGRKRNIAYLNEGNELMLEDFRQINMRTTDRVIIDLNPSDPVHWIFDEVMPREDCDTFITTYKDNKFLPDDLVFEIERMRERDPDYWRVYGEGQRAVFSKRQIFNNWEFMSHDKFPVLDDYVLGVDFGYSNDPTAIIEIAKHNDTLYINELKYESGMTNKDIADFIIATGHQDTLCFADSAEPKSIDEIKRLGVMMRPAVKGIGSINAGISLLKEYDIIASSESKNLFKEYNTYYWQQLRDDTIINKPVDKNNHLMDALRYGVYSQYRNRTDFFVI